MRIGFTGTQRGMTVLQAIQLMRFLQSLAVNKDISEAHHGDCIGADSEFHYAMYYFACGEIHIHPCNIRDKRAFSKVVRVNTKLVLHDPKPPLERNKDIADVDILIATPKEYKRVIRSGTWATIRYALKKGTEVRVIYPSGEVSIL